MKTLKQTPIFGRYLWIALLIGLAGLTLHLQLKHTKQKDELLTQIEDLRSSINNHQRLLERRPELKGEDLEELQRKGLKDPLKEIVAGLQKHPELIPYKGVLGGRMGFYFADMIWVLNKKWVFAYFEDGHIGGWMLLEFKVSQGGKISFSNELQGRVKCITKFLLLARENRGRQLL